MKTLKTAILSLSAAALLVCNSPASACNECHSKNPKMVQMHKELEFKDCFKCHFNGSLKKGDELKAMTQTDDRCVRCHKK